MAEYINVFQTPWIRYTSSSILQDANFREWYEKNNRRMNGGNQALYVLNSQEKEESDQNVKKLILDRLAFREYVINEDINNYVIFNSRQLSNQSIIGYYVSLCQTTPVDSRVMRHVYGKPEQYLTIPFSNGSYYGLINPYSNQASKEYTWKYVREAVDILGYSNIFNFCA